MINCNYYNVNIILTYIIDLIYIYYYFDTNILFFI